MRHIFLSQSPAQTSKIAKIIAEELIRTKSGNNAFVLALNGDLGSGKTTFAKAFIKALGVNQNISSPTFVISRVYKIKKGRFLYHIDCYRINSKKEIEKLGFKDWISHPDHIILVEWANKIKTILPKDTIYINFAHGKKHNHRIIEIYKSK
jgi:tRNA threonylcarbamoyladenosine biosynthesis protein TsaE